MRGDLAADERVAGVRERGSKIEPRTGGDLSKTGPERSHAQGGQAGEGQERDESGERNAADLG